jgi:hypothetical protein
MIGHCGDCRASFPKVEVQKSKIKIQRRDAKGAKNAKAFPASYAIRRSLFPHPNPPPLGEGVDEAADTLPLPPAGGGGEGGER